jgi:hypothetical protein
MSMRKINTKQLTRIKYVINHGKKRFYFRYYCPDLQKDNLKKFANIPAWQIGYFIPKSLQIGLLSNKGTSTPFHQM